MKNGLKIFGLAAFLMLAFTSCKKEDKHFCIDNISASGTLALGELTITVPGEQAYTGIGALPGPFKIGNYEGQISSVIIKQTPTETGMLVELRHYFDDGKGNAFWSHDHALMTPVDGSETQFNVYDEMALWVGTGDFECATGMIVNHAVADFASSKLNFNCTGSICGGCN